MPTLRDSPLRIVRGQAHSGGRIKESPPCQKKIEKGFGQEQAREVSDLWRAAYWGLSW